MNYTLKPFLYSSHSKIIDLVKPNTKVLDIACASGYLASFLQEKGCTIDGVDFDDAYIEEAKKYCNAYVLDITKEDVVGMYDVIILGDILEHTVDPEGILRKIQKNLTKDGYIIISTPNIVNIYARIKILFGNFDYAEKGIFDKTHVHFFTRKTLRQTVDSAGYDIEKMEYTIIPVQLVFKKLPKSIINSVAHILYGITTIWPTLFAYQFVVKISCKK
ncbi:MAG: class I SAM-dependent methyltransferase [bacterium]